MQKLNVLIVDDENRFREEIVEFLLESDYFSFSCGTAEEATQILERHPIDIIILDIRLESSNGLDFLKTVKQRFPKIEVIVVSGHGDMDTVIDAMRLGAMDYLKKPFRHIDITKSFQRSERYRQIQQKLKQVEQKYSLIDKDLEKLIERHLIGVSSQLRRVLDIAMTVSTFSDTNVFITGESGTGKENIARIIHYQSQRKNHLFCAVSSSAISETLSEREYFGYKKGSFRGAKSDKKGFFEICNKGTLFLDEIADMPVALQAKMLRVIEEKAVIPLGDTAPIQTDFRIVSSSNYSLDTLIKAKKIRTDLLYRLNTLHIHIPPLRERPEDIEPLLHFYADNLSKKLNKVCPVINEDVIKAFNGYSFPGNVRELKNMIEQALILSKGDVLKLKDFNLTLRSWTTIKNKVAATNLEENLTTF